MGSFKDLMGMIPGMAGLKDLDASDEQFGTVEAIICSMTREERKSPQVIGASRRQRIASGSGTSINDVSRLLKQFEEVTRQLSSFSRAARMVDRLAGSGRPKERVLTVDERKAIKKRRKAEKLRRKQGRR
jgi:signal recognition particle subunit SRP54